MAPEDGRGTHKTVEDKRRRSAILRNLQMLDLIPMYPNRITVTELHNRLTQEYGYRISKRSIQRDLENLSEWACIDFEKKDTGNVWFRDLAKNQYAEMNPAEAFILLINEEHNQNLLPAQFYEQYTGRLAIAKTMLASKHALSDWRSKISLIRGGYPVEDALERTLDNTRNVIYSSVLNEQEIIISYTAEGYLEPVTFTLNPLGIIIRDNSYYLVATKITSPETPQLFLFHRISTAYTTYKDITFPKSFELQSYLASNPSGWKLKESIEQIKISVRKFALDDIKRNPLGTNQNLKPLADGWVEAIFFVVPTYDLIAWILKYGADVTVESPVHLKDRVVKILKESISHYEN